MLRLLICLLILVGCSPAAEHWWEKEPLRIIDLSTAMGGVDYMPPTQAAEQKAKLGFNTEHLEIMEMPGGMDDGHFFFSTKLASAPKPDFLRPYITEAHKRGIRVLIYFNVHWYSKAFGARHPDWLQINENGKPIDDVYSTGTSFCVNSPWRKWCFQLLRDLAAYGVDGVFYDGPIFFPKSCYCSYCRAQFKERYGKDLPSKQVRHGQDFKNLIDFQADSLAAFLRDSNKELKSINPELAFYMNGGVRGGNWATGRMNRTLIREQDLLGSEGGFISGDLTRVPLWKPGLTARLLETQAGGKPRVIFSAGGHKPWTFSILPAPELKLLYADTIANAASVWLSATPFEFDQPEMQTVAQMNRFVETNAKYFQHTRSEAKIAIVWSDTTANFYAGAGAQLIDVDTVKSQQKAGNLDAEFGGVAEALLRAHAPFDVIDDTTLEREDLSRYSLIVLPNVACMSDTVAARLRKYVQDGGSIFSTLETSLYDDTGIRRKDFALADVLGASDARKLQGPRRWDFMRPAEKDPILGTTTREIIPSPLYYETVVPNSAKPILRYSKPLAGPYDGIPETSQDSALLVNRFGKGRAVYFTGDLGNSIETFHTPELLAIANHIVQELAPPQIEISGAPGSVELVVRSQDQGKRLLLHFVNFTGEMTRPIQHVQPVEGIRVTLPGTQPVTKAYTLMHHSAIPTKTDAQGRVQLTLPRIDEYEVLVLER